MALDSIWLLPLLDGVIWIWRHQGHPWRTTVRGHTRAASSLQSHNPLSLDSQPLEVRSTTFLQVLKPSSLCVFKWWPVQTSGMFCEPASGFSCVTHGIRKQARSPFHRQGQQGAALLWPARDATPQTRDSGSFQDLAEGRHLLLPFAVSFLAHGFPGHLCCSVQLLTSWKAPSGSVPALPLVPGSPSSQPQGVLAAAR